MWYRVFGAADDGPAPPDVLDFLAGHCAAASGRFDEGASGWYQAELAADGVAFEVERYLAGEEGIRGELNSWAAWLETRPDAPEAAPLMERMIQSRQLFTLRADRDTPRARQIAEELCRFLARAADGIYQIDGRGLFAADGRLLVGE